MSRLRGAVCLHAVVCSVLQGRAERAGHPGRPQAGAWVDRSSGEVLRTAQGGYMELNFTRTAALLPG